MGNYEDIQVELTYISISNPRLQLKTGIWTTQSSLCASTRASATGSRTRLSRPDGRADSSSPICGTEPSALGAYT